MLLRKAWLKRYHARLYDGGDFTQFLQRAIEQSECDRFGREHFQHSAGGYIFSGDYEAFQREIYNNSFQLIGN